MCRRLIYVIFLVVALFLTGSVQAQIIPVAISYVETTDQNWSTLGNWSTGVLPTVLDRVEISSTSGLPQSVIINSGFDAVAHSTYIGYTGGGTLTVDGGTLTIPYDTDDSELRVGFAGGAGLLTMNSGTIDIGEDLDVADGYPGTVNMYGGTIIIGDDLWIPKTNGYLGGVFNLYDGTINIDDEIQMDYPGGVLNMYGGAINVRFVDLDGTSGGTINMYGGIFSISGDLDNDGGGDGDGGTINLYGGTLDIGDDLDLSSSDTLSREVNVYDGTLIIRSQLQMQSLNSTMNVYGGITTITESIVMTNVTGNGTLNLVYGTITVEGAGEVTPLRMAGPGAAPGDAAIDIVAGTLILFGDEVSTVEEYIHNGWITGYGGNDANAFVDYDVTNPGKTTVIAIHDLDPNPGDYAVVLDTTDTLGWTLPAPISQGSTVTCDVVFGTDPNMLNLSVNTLTQGLTDSLGIAIVIDMDYYWQVTVYDSGFVEPVLVSPVFRFTTKNIVPTANAGDDIETWLVGGTRDIQLAGAAIDGDGGPGPYSYLWEVTSSANEQNPATLNNATLANATVTLPEIGVYTLSLMVDDGKDPSAADDRIQITVYADACIHASNQAGFTALVGDTDDDCDVDLTDLANVAATWLLKNYSTDG